jgi:choline dehydrogenase
VTEGKAEAFDVVVVGGGAAGCVAAARLAEGSSRSVLLLEAGPDLRGRLPGDFRDGWGLNREFDWGFVAEPNARGEVESLRRGKLLGGTSWVTRFALRGAPGDYDEWAALGNPGWGFDDVLPFFTGLEADANFGERPWHGDGGPLPVDRYLGLELSEVAAASLAALEAAGFPAVEDHNEPGAVGAGRMPMSSRDGVRVTTADAYLPEAGAASNLTIRPDAQVDAVVLDGKRAAGVRLVDGAVVEAGRVVLSAGTYGSPAVLLRSGIGPAEHLRSVGVPVRVDLPGVGANLADHLGVEIDCGYGGAARETPVLHVVATFHSSATPSDQAPDLMLWLCDPVGDPPGFEINPCLMRPRSRGSVTLRSADPTEAPRIELPGLRDPRDIERLAEAYRRGLEVAHRPEIRRLCADAPAPDVRDDAEVRALVEAEAYSIPHVVGTCAMGPRPDEGAVVDARGRVHGVDGLSVVDASIIPNGPSAFTHLPTIMLAERLSAEITSQQ